MKITLMMQQLCFYKTCWVVVMLACVLVLEPVLLLVLVSSAYRRVVCLQASRLPKGVPLR